MMRRKVLAGIGALAAGGTAAMGTGAFNEVQATRDVTLTVAPDDGALLTLTSASQYAQATGTPGTLELTFEDLNVDAVTQFLHVFDIHNAGDETVGLQIDSDALNNEIDNQSPDPGNAHMHFFVGEHGGVTMDGYDKSDMSSTLDYGTPSNDARVIESGQTCPVGCYAVNVGGNWDIDSSITINALEESNANAVASP